MNPLKESPSLNRISRLALLIATCLFAAACGGPDRPPTVKVSGKVTFDGASPPAAGTIYFNPITVAEGLPRRPGSGEFDSEGNYSVTSFEQGDGLVPGTYAVKIECWKVSSGYTNDVEESYIPRGFEPAKLVVAADQKAIEHHVDVSK